MKQDVFEKLLDELDGNSIETLKSKNAKYAKGSGDCLHNFKAGSEITGRTPAQTCWGYASKHIVALRDMIERDDFSDREDFLEKCQDTINYIRFLWCIGNEEDVESKLEDVFEHPYLNLIVENKFDGSKHLYPSETKPTLCSKTNTFMVVFTENGKTLTHDYEYRNYFYYFDEERKDNHE